MVQQRDFTYITEPFIEREIEHLARMIRSRHWHRSVAWPVSYWRERIERLRQAPAAAPGQQAQLLSLLVELEGIAAQLESSSSSSSSTHGEMLHIGAQPVRAAIGNAR
ncbi:conserved hypothetical protein [Burkholderia sp. 8Y]|uniref:hypothetical protein n=1 Tax=Burkholderia sp. 8Y TaxID=2653133 RepID=UPI0012EFB773|nr:hypothetical protein [Burkholderia sp. 8Y]VXB36439.1 conserved hypothetical protein [Burkholderia sp. 8Y]